MNKKIDNAYLNQYTDNAIKRGYEIYDEWISKGQTSRKIVASAHDAVKFFKKRKTMAAFVEVLAYIFAIDTRIKEKYKNVLRCLFSYFSWRRETRALATLKTLLNIPLGETDMRHLIAVEIEKLAQKLANGWDEDEDDEAHGGKRNGRAEDEAATEEKEIEQTDKEEQKTEDIDDKEEQKDSEEKEEAITEEVTEEETQVQTTEKNETAEPELKEAVIKEAYVKEQLTQEKVDNLKKENNTVDFKSEPNTNKKEEARAYNDAVDSTPLYEATVRDRSSKKASITDEIIIDDMLKTDKDIGYWRIDEAERDGKTDISQDTLTNQNEKIKSTDKDAYLYNKTIGADKDEAQQTLKAESTQQAEKASVTKSEQPKETIQNNNNVNSTKEEVKPSSETVQSNNPKVDPDNDIANAINTHMSLESKMSLIRMKEDQFREQIKITLEELGMNDTVDVLRVSEPDEVSPPSAVQSRK